VAAQKKNATIVVFFGGVAEWLDDWKNVIAENQYPDTWIGIMGSYAKKFQNQIPESQRIPDFKTPPPPTTFRHLNYNDMFAKGWYDMSLQAAWALAEQLRASGKYETITIQVVYDDLMRDAVREWLRRHPEDRGKIREDTFFMIIPGYARP